jgi:hypothetical protein
VLDLQLEIRLIRHEVSTLLRMRRDSASATTTSRRQQLTAQ